MPDLGSNRTERLSRADISVPGSRASSDATSRPVAPWLFSTRVLPSLLAVAFGAGDPAASFPLKRDEVAVNAHTGVSAAQTAARAFRNTQRLSLRQARGIVLAAVARAEAERKAEREEEARFWASLDK